MSAHSEKKSEVSDEKQVTWEDLGIIDSIAKSCRELGWEYPTQIQKETIPVALKGQDVIGLSQTGSGKTGAFALPILQALMKNPQGLFACILAPTRELAFQIAEQFEALGTPMGVSCVTIVGGVDVMAQAVCLAKKPHIIVGTPGRIVHHLQNTKGFSLNKLKYFVLDEADRLLNLDFEDAIDTILSVIPKDRVSFLFSATMTSKVGKLQRASLRNPVKIEVSSKFQTVDTLVQQYLFVPEMYKDCYLTYLVTQFTGHTIIVFTSKCITGQKLALMLRSLGCDAVPLHGKMSQAKRLGALNKFKAGERSILVATDVASRGLDIPDVDIVINYDIPQSTKDYIHRVGRTARIGRSGKAFNLVSQYDIEFFQKIEEYIGKKMDLYPTEEETVLILMERVSEAQRMATIELKKENFGKKKKRKGKDFEVPEDSSDYVKLPKKMKSNR